MQAEYVFITGAAARAAWGEWQDALGARVDHELECWQSGGGCDTREQFCLIGFDLHDAEQRAHRAYTNVAARSAVAA